jgi:hypothetical protein
VRKGGCGNPPGYICEPLNYSLRVDFSQPRLAELRKKKCPCRTAIEMSQRPPTPPERRSSEEPRVRFNWPPTEDELAQYAAEGLRPDTEFDAAGLEGEEPPAGDASPATETIGQFLSERAARLPVFPQEASPSPSPSDSGLDLAGAPPAALFTLPEPPRATAVDPSGTGDFADEIAHLQALIEGLTKKIEWRIPGSSVAGR